MQVATKALFNLLSQTNDKNVKEKINTIISNQKDSLIDTKTLDSSNTKTQNTKDVIESLLKDLSNNTKTKENVQTNLKQNDIPKLMENTSKELNSLLELVKSDKTLIKYAPMVEKLVLHVKEITPETLKSSLEKSGTFFESNLTSSTKQTMPASLKEALNNLKSFILQNSSNQEQQSLHVKTIDTLLSATKADKSFVDTLVKLVKDIKQNVELPKSVNQPIEKLENIIKQDIPIKDTNVKEVLTNLKEIIVKTSSNQEQQSLHVKTIDTLLNAPKADKAFMTDIKTLLNNLKTTDNPNKAIIEITAKLETLVQKSTLVESKIQNTLSVKSENVTNEIPKSTQQSTLSTQSTQQKQASIEVSLPKEILKVSAEIKEVLIQLKDVVSKQNTQNASVLLEKSQSIIQMVDTTLNMPNFFSKGLSGASVSEQIQQVVNLLKSELSKSDVKSSLHVEVSKLTQKLESVIKEQVATKNIVPNQKLQTDVPIKSELLSDVKGTLLNIKSELSASTVPAHREVLAQVDRLLTQIDYFQLVSLSSNTSTTYLPFSWDDLEGGQVSLKKLKENRFFCEINLTLKEYGKIDLMIMLYEDININISVFAEKKEFLTLVQENLSELKQGINKLGLIPSNIQLFDALKEKNLKEDTRNFASSAQLGSGINIKV